MELTAITDQALKQLISETSKVELNFLAAKILLATLRAKVKVDPSPATLAHSVSELKDLLTRFEKLPAVQGDLQKLGVAAPGIRRKPGPVQRRGGERENRRRAGTSCWPGTAPC